MKTGVKYSDVKYFKNGSKYVTCKLTYEIVIPHELCGDYTIADVVERFSEDHTSFIGYNSCNPEFVSVGVAKLDNRDSYDETTGKRIALTKAQAKAFQTAKALYDKISLELVSVAGEFHKYSVNCDSAKSDCLEHVQFLDKENNE